MLQSKPMKAGAGGNWRRFNEKFDKTIVQQTTGLSCVSAVGEMLLKTRGFSVSQTDIRDIIGEPAGIEMLAKTLNSFDNSKTGKKWHGGFYLPGQLDFVLSQKKFGIIFQEPLTMGHAVFVEGVNSSGLIIIRDPFDQTTYQMTKADFNNAWGRGTIFYGKIE